MLTEGRRFGAVVGMAALLAGCATLPPRKPVTDISAIAGRWEGTVSTARGAYPAKSVINADGTGITEVPAVAPGKFQIQYTITNGRVQYVSKTTNRSGACSLHEGEGRRVLSCRADDGASSVDWTPVAQ